MVESTKKKTGHRDPKRQNDAGDERDIERERHETLRTAGRAEDEDDLEDEDEDEEFEEDDEA